MTTSAIRVRHHALGMRDSHAAQNDVVALAEGVHVETLSDSHRRILPSFSIYGGYTQVRDTRYFDVERRTLHQRRPQSQPFDGLRLIGHGDAGEACFLQRMAQLRKRQTPAASVPATTPGDPRLPRAAQVRV